MSELTDLMDQANQHTTVPVISGIAVTAMHGDATTDEMTVNESLILDGENVGATLQLLKDRFLVLEDDFKKHEQYPALKDAYEKYKLIEKLLLDSK